MATAIAASSLLTRARIVNAALEQRAERIGKDADDRRVGRSRSDRCADALVDIARDDLAEHPGPDPTVVVVHVDADVVDGTAEGNGSIDGIPVPVDSVRRLLCDCAIEYSVDGPDGTCIGIGRAGRQPPRWLRRRCLERDGTCRFPGCGRRIRHVHHIQHWTKGGATDSWNLVGLCWEHHHLVHEGGWTIEGNADGELTFTSPFGVRRASRPNPLDPKVRRRIQEATGVDLHATTTSHPPAPTHPDDDPAPWHPARPARAAAARPGPTLPLVGLRLPGLHVPGEVVQGRGHPRRMVISGDAVRYILRGDLDSCALVRCFHGPTSWSWCRRSRVVGDEVHRLDDALVADDVDVPHLDDVGVGGGLPGRA